MSLNALANTFSRNDDATGTPAKRGKDAELMDQKLKKLQEQKDLSDQLHEILAEGQDVNAYPPAWKSVYQPTALAYAVWGNQPEAVRLLLERGADPNQPDGVGG